MISKIDKRSVNNARIPDHYIKTGIDKINELVAEVNRLSNSCQCQDSATVAKSQPVESVEDEPGLPEDIPHRDILVAAGFSSVDDVRAANLTGTKGLGPKRAGEIKEWLD